MNKQSLENWLDASWMIRAFVGSIAVYLLVAVVLGFIWSDEPEPFSVTNVTADYAEQEQQSVVTGYTTSITLMKVAETLLQKSGGYLTNDILPPGLWLDNIPHWEYGVLVQVRDLSRALRKDFSRSQSQSTENLDLAVAEPQFHFDNNSWALPDSEGEYQRGIDKLASYAHDLADNQQSAQFFARADNLRQWLKDVETRLGSLSQRLSASVGQKRINIDLAGNTANHQSTENDDEFVAKTPWTEIDDVFYEARGTTWALMHFLKAVEVDFADILHKKNALVSVKQIVRELEATQEEIWSPVILNGSGFGLTANHSLVMASYIARANAAIIDLRRLLSEG
ncbi:DUF2333 family protein [Bermanella marisrubri]|uniref:DUF2333 family protein n=1 Tax=Bermanella marisrubri TaxID=207949 RepID=Q1N3J3_9GAMM|nr:hypothetical protein RED65_12449 [Oceanobacter sp. RED65] [Bermanella marisrubri]